MRTIDGTRYISFKEYADMISVSPSRVNQLKDTLPVEKFEEFGKELINYDLLQLPEQVKALAELKFSTVQPVHTFTYQQLGTYFGQLLHELSAGRQNAESLLAEKTATLDQWQTKAAELQAKVSEVTELLNSETNNKELLETRFHELTNELNQVTAERDSLSSQLETAYERMAEQAEQLKELEAKINSQLFMDEMVEKVLAKLNSKKR